MKNDMIISVKRDLKGDLIFTRGMLKEILRSFAGRSIKLQWGLDEVSCRVTRQSCLVMNPRLKIFLETLESDSFILSPDYALPQDAATFIVLPLSVNEEELNQLNDLLFEHFVESAEFQVNKREKKLPAGKKGRRPPRPSAKSSPRHIAVGSAETIKKGAAAKAPAKTSAKAAEKTPARKNKPGSAKTGQDLPEAPVQGADPPEQQLDSPVYIKPEKPVRINFSDAAAEQILAAAERGQEDGPADLELHRSALLLSLSPGFDTLLSLPVVRNVEPLDYQLATVRHVLKNLRGRALLCDEVGLGKTIEAGLIMMEYMLRGLVRRVLVLTPPSLVEQWQEELQTKFNLDFITYDQPKFKSHPRPWEHFERVVASLDTAKRKQNQEQVLAPEYDLVIVDEAHHLKNHRTLAYQVVQQLKKKYILLLTATPVENNLEELFNLITLLLPGQLETASSFKRKYITRGDPLKPKNTEDLKKLVREVMIRNRRSETGVIQVRRRAEVVEVALFPEEQELYRRLTAFVRLSYQQKSSAGEGVNQFILKLLQREAGSSPAAVLSTLEKLGQGGKLLPPEQQELVSLVDCARKISRWAKAEALLKLLQRLPEKVIVFTAFQETQRQLVSFLQQHGLEVAQLHGGMRRLQKEEQVKLFAEKGRILLSTDIGSEGRNLQFCRYVVNYDLPWNPMRIEQRIGRLHRLGQKKDVYILNFSAKQTVESYILELLDAKINMFQLVVGELDMILGSLKEKKDFETIIMDIWSGVQNEAELEREMEQLGERFLDAKKQYEAVRLLDDRLLGELLPHEG